MKSKIVNKLSVVLMLVVILHSVVGFQLSWHTCPCCGDFHYDVELITGVDETTIHLDAGPDGIDRIALGGQSDCCSGEVCTVRMLDITSITERVEKVKGPESFVCSDCTPVVCASRCRKPICASSFRKERDDRRPPKHSPQQLLCVIRC